MGGEERSDKQKVVSYCALVVYGRSIETARSEATSLRFFFEDS